MTHRVMVVVLCASFSAAAAQAPPTGLEWLEPKDIAFVEVKGVVRDDATNAPIAGANVEAIWTGATYGFHSTSYNCLRVDATRTRPDGSFSFVAPANAVYRKGMAQQGVDVRVHSRGMEERFEPGAMYRAMKTTPDKRSAAVKLAGPKELGLEMEPRLIAMTQDASDRLRFLKELAEQPVQSCETQGDSHEIQLYLEALAAEARSLATTKYQRTISEDLASCARMVSCPATVWTLSHQVDPADPDSRNHQDMTPLMYGAQVGDLRFVRAMLEAGANPNRTRRDNDLIGGDSALTIAMAQLVQRRVNRLDAAKYEEIIQALLADPRTKADMRDRVVDLTPLMKALYMQQDDVVGWLLAAGADPTLVAYGGKYSAMSVALQALNTTHEGKPLPAATNQLELLLAAKKIDLDQPMGEFGATALTQSLQRGQNDLARRLLEAGASPNAADRAKRTPLIVSTQASILNPQHPKFVEGVRLIAAWRGVDFTSVYEGKTALQMARAASRADLVAIIEKK